MPFENRNIATHIILSIITCGIYGIFWVIKMGRDAVRIKDVNDSGTLEIVLMIFFPFIGFFLAEKKFAEGCQMYGVPHEDRSVLYLVLGLFGLGIVNYALMQSDLNKLADMGFVPGTPVE